MEMWWLLGGLATAVAIALLYRKWSGKRPAPLAARYIMTKTADGEPLQFLVRATAEHGEHLDRRVLQPGASR